MRGEISYDLVMEAEMEFVEGVYRLEQGVWHVFVISKAPVDTAQKSSSQWDSGCNGIVIRLPQSVQLNKETVENVMSQMLEVDGWDETTGPDSMQLR